jgi:endo-1,3-1,4-beta-glycanase ExoK
MGGQSTGGGDGDAVTPGLGNTPADSAFKLLFRDDFEILDTTRWRLMTHSWAGNLAVFSAQAATVQDGHLDLTLLPAPEGTMSDGGAKSFLGAEVRSVDTLTYGRVRARARFAGGSAVVSSLVTIYTPWPADNWNELDIEVLGKDPSHAQFNAMVYTGALPAPTTPVSPTQHPLLVDLGFDVSADFHEFMIEWTPDGAWFWVDDVLRHTWTEKIDLMNLPQNILLTIWASGSAGWAGSVTEETLGAKATYDWIELYEYTPG